MARRNGARRRGDGCFAYIQGDGSWGWSNAGLIVGDGRSLLVDTLFDLRLTAAMLDGVGAAHGERRRSTSSSTPTPTATTATATSSSPAPRSSPRRRRPRRWRRSRPPCWPRSTATPGEVGDLFRSFFGEFQFDGIEQTLPTRTFDGRLTLDVGGRVVELIEVGPAHTRGDAIVHVPDARTVFTGDILFIGGTPIVWAGPLGNWIAACDLMLGMDVDVVVPGHGPLTDKAGVTAVRDYLAFVEREATARHDAGVDAFDAAREIARLVDAGEDFGVLGRGRTHRRQRRDRVPHDRPGAPQPRHRRAVPPDGRARAVA